MPEPQLMLCPTCSADVPADQDACPRCGTPTTEVTTEGEVLENRSADETEYRGRLQQALGDEYHLGTVIGRGGFGVVYAAWDSRLERPVAVKAIRHDVFPTPALLERFKREARAVGKLQHPNVLPVHTVGTGDGLAFMVMPKVDGESLRERLKREGTLSAEEARRIGKDVAGALAAAHEAGLVHRDVKPENILLDRPTGRALLMDFGVAKAPKADTVGLTGTGMAIGSPAYMSPEQARGEQVDSRSDVYSLSAVLYEMLTGALPFAAPNLHALVYHQVTTTPKRIEDLAPDAQPEFSRAVMKGLAKAPQDRWDTAAELAEALGGRTAIGSLPRMDSSPSWVASRVPILLMLYLPAAYLRVMRVVLDSGGDPFWNVMGAPVLFLLETALILLLLELPVRVFSVARASRSLKAVLFDLFGQPRWWRTWYPRAFRQPDDRWGRLPPSARLARSILWFFLVTAPFAIPLIFAVPTLVSVYAASGLPLPLPIRLVIATSSLIRAYGWVAPIWIVGTVLFIMARYRVGSEVAMHIIAPWHNANWQSEAAQRVLK